MKLDYDKGYPVVFRGKRPVHLVTSEDGEDVITHCGRRFWRGHYEKNMGLRWGFNPLQPEMEGVPLPVCQQCTRKYEAA